MSGQATPRRPGARRKHWVLAVALLVLAVGIGGETLARLLLVAPASADGCPNPIAPGWCRPSGAVFQPHPILRWEYRPRVTERVVMVGHPDGGFLFHTNSRGLRQDTEVIVPKPPGVFRILVLGDEQTAGYVHNAETYPAQLEARLRERGMTGVEVVNGAVAIYEAPWYPLWYAVHGRELQPDLVIVGLCLGNDLANLTPPTEPLEDPDGTLRLAPTAQLRYQARLARDWLRDHSLFWRGLGDGSLLAAVQHPGPPLVRRAATTPAPLRECWGCWTQHFGQQPWTSPERVTRTRAGLEAILARLERQVSRDGARLVVLPIPTKAMVEPDDERQAIDAVIQFMGLSEEAVRSYDQPLAITLAAAADLGLPVINPLAALQATAASARLFYQRDWHLTPAGHHALAEALTAALLDPALVPRQP